MVSSRPERPSQADSPLRDAGPLRWFDDQDRESFFRLAALAARLDDRSEVQAAMDRTGRDYNRSARDWQENRR